MHGVEYHKGHLAVYFWGNLPCLFWFTSSNTAFWGFLHSITSHNKPNYDEFGLSISIWVCLLTPSSMLDHLLLTTMHLAEATARSRLPFPSRSWAEPRESRASRRLCAAACLECFSHPACVSPDSAASEHGAQFPAAESRRPASLSLHRTCSAVDD